GLLVDGADVERGSPPYEMCRTEYGRGMKHDALSDGTKLCAWCGSEIRQSGVGRNRGYCRRSCCQRAYEARVQREAIASRVAAVVARWDSSRVKSRTPKHRQQQERIDAAVRSVEIELLGASRDDSE
ncbi:hypothetical protein AB0G85_38215, partial [Streptomyces sioyaensis]